MGDTAVPTGRPLGGRLAMRQRATWSDGAGAGDGAPAAHPMRAASGILGLVPRGSAADDGLPPIRKALYSYAPSRAYPRPGDAAAQPQAPAGEIRRRSGADPRGPGPDQ